jgi:hypothetical protein
MQKDAQTAHRCAVEKVPCHDGALFPAGPKTATIDGAGRVVVVVEAAGGGWNAVPFAVRLRRWIKSAGRAYGLRVVSIRREGGHG